MIFDSAVPLLCKEGALPFQDATDPVGDRNDFSTTGSLCTSETTTDGTSVDSAGSAVVEESFGIADEEIVEAPAEEEVGLYGTRCTGVPGNKESPVCDGSVGRVVASLDVEVVRTDDDTFHER